MKKLYASLILAGLVGVPSLAMAADSPHSFTANVGLATDYVFRGVSQTQNEPAIQGGVDYSHASGIYVGTWASNVEWVSTGYKDNNSMEIDLYGGYKGSVGDIGYDLGLITYYYPGDQIAAPATDPDTTEVYVGLGWKTVSLKYSHTVSDRFVGWSTAIGGKTKGSYYLDLSGTYDLGGGWGLLGHVGYQDVKGNDNASYTDWKVGVTKDVGFGTVSLAYTDTDADTATYTWTSGTHAEKVADGRVVLSFLKTF